VLQHLQKIWHKRISHLSLYNNNSSKQFLLFGTKQQLKKKTILCLVFFFDWARPSRKEDEKTGEYHNKASSFWLSCVVVVVWG
jgi:hypothetical protein